MDDGEKEKRRERTKVLLMEEGERKSGRKKKMIEKTEWGRGSGLFSNIEKGFKARN